MSPTPKLSPFAGKLPEATDLVDLDRLLFAYETDQPDPSIPAQRVSFGTSGHRGSSFHRTFNRDHILATTQAICLYRKKNGITGPLFLGFDTHALSLPAFRTTLEVLAANEVTVMTAENEEFTPTPVISHAILTYNKGRTSGLSDGIVITPSHNPPDEGGFKYNPVHGGPAEKEVTDWIQAKANEILIDGLKTVRKIPFDRAIKSGTTYSVDFIGPYVDDLKSIIDMEIIRGSRIKIGVDPLGGAGVHYWGRVAEKYRLDMTILNTKVDPSFRFMSRDWDGKIRMDPSSRYAMQSLIQKSQQHDISFGCDTDHDRHGIVTKSAGLMPANHYLAVAIHYLFTNRPEWKPHLKIGKTLVSSQIIDRVGSHLNREVYEVPVGFKWFVDGLLDESLGFGGEESAGASFLRKDGTVWTTDKDAFIPSLLSAEMTAKLGKDPAILYGELTEALGNPSYRRVDAPLSKTERAALNRYEPKEDAKEMIGGDAVDRILTKASGNGASIGGMKIETKNGWLAVRPSGTEDIYKIYAESFQGEDHLTQLIGDGQALVSKILSAG